MAKTEKPVQEAEVMTGVDEPSFIEKTDALDAILDSENIPQDEPPMPLPTPLEEDPQPDIPGPEPIPEPTIVGRYGTYARPDGNCVTLISCVVISGTKAMARLSVKPSPGKTGFEVDAPHAEELYAGSWRLAQ